MPQIISRGRAKSAQGGIKQEAKNQAHAGGRHEAQMNAAVGYSGLNTNSKPRDQVEVDRAAYEQTMTRSVPIIGGRPMQSI
jgi:hypothetical protein